MKPTSGLERVQLLDILRGVAIFGMFTVNMTADIWWADQYPDSTLPLADSTALILVNLFSNGKFITIFSFLFGIGFYVQSERVVQRGASVPVFWVRRLAGLLVIGLVAEACTLPSWILIDYSMFGLGLLLVYRLSPRWIMAAAAVCIAVPKLYGTILPLFVPQADPETTVAATGSVLEEIHASIDNIFATGSFAEIGSTNLVHVWGEFTQWQYYLGDLDLLGLMMIGLFVGRIDAVWNRDIQVAVARKFMPWLLGIGFAGCAGWVVLKTLGVDENSPTYLHLTANFLAWPIGMPVLGLGYAAAITLLIDRPKWRRVLALFEPVGKMALTNYLFTGFVLAVLSFQWGFGFYGEIYPAIGLLIVIAVLPLQIYLSRRWLARYAYGPFEWLWRSWTYGRVPRMRLKPA